MSKNKTDKDKEKHYTELGQAVSAIFESGALNKKQFFKYNFLRGMISGIGGVVGITIVLALLLWILSLFSEVPLVGGFFENVKTTIESR